MSDPLITVIMPTYNRAHLIKRSIDSVRNQTYPNWDLVIVDDRSTDNTLDVIQSYLDEDKRIRCVRNDTHAHNAGGARNRGLEEIDGEYVAFLDSDDTWLDYHLDELLEHLLGNRDIDWIFGDLRRVDEEGRVIIESKFRQECKLELFSRETRGSVHLFKPDDLVENSLRYGVPASLQTSLIRSDVFCRVRFREEAPIVEDRLFGLEAPAHGVTVAFVDRVHLNYLVHRENKSGSNKSPTLDHLVEVNKVVERYWAELVPSTIPMTDLAAASSNATSLITSSGTSVTASFARRVGDSKRHVISYEGSHCVHGNSLTGKLSSVRYSSD